MRINLIDPKSLSDQHLIAEYNEILMLIGYVNKYSSLKGIPNEYCLGKGHIKFFKNKLLYLKKRHEKIKVEMRQRGFATNKNINLEKFNKNLLNNWKPDEHSFKIIKKRLKEKLSKRPTYYRYKGRKESSDFLIKLIDRS